MPVVIRPAVPGDGPVLREIEWQAGERFREVGLDSVADMPPYEVDKLARYADGGRSFVACAQATGQPVGYVLVDRLDGNGHVEQLSVRPSWQGQGVGRALIDRAAEWAAAARLPALTLTTFREWPGTARCTSTSASR